MIIINHKGLKRLKFEELDEYLQTINNEANDKVCGCVKYPFYCVVSHQNCSSLVNEEITNLTPTASAITNTHFKYAKCFECVFLLFDIIAQKMKNRCLKKNEYI